MSRLELNAIQSKLKAAIQSHQMLVVRMKGDNQNTALKKGLAELQEEIKRLSDEQKKIVVKLRESLVKSTSQPLATSIPLASVGSAITAIGQPRLVSFPTQGGATILPVGMVAVPIAHMQRPAIGMAINTAHTGQICQTANLSIRPAEFAAVAGTAHIPTAVISSGTAIPINNINSGGALGINNIPIHNSMALGGINNGTSSLIINTNIPTTNVGCITINNQNSSGHVININNSGSINNNGNINSNNTSSNTGNNAHIISNGTVLNSVNPNTSSSGVVEISSCLSNGVTAPAPSLSQAVSTVSCPTSVVASTVTTVSSSPTTGAAGVIMSFPQQPLVQPQLLHQQQQQILQMIQQQQQHPPHQRLASHLPIKVPQYTASPIRPMVTSTSVQYCSIAPAPSTVVPTSHAVGSAHQTSGPALHTSGPTLHTAGPAPIASSITVPSKPSSTLANAKVQKEQQQPQQQQQQQQQQAASRKQEHVQASPVKKLSAQEREKLKFMQALELFTPEALKEVLMRRSERKRRTTANPNYSFTCDAARRQRNGNIWDAQTAKRAKVVRTTKPSAKDVSSSGNEKGFVKNSDNHDDYCAACGKGGQLLMCATCRLVYHLDCLKPPLTEAPTYAWSCPKCLVSGKGSVHLSNEALAKVHSYIAKKASKEEEKKKLQKKLKEINREKSFLDKRSTELGNNMKGQTRLKEELSSKEKSAGEELNKLSQLVKLSQSPERSCSEEQPCLVVTTLN